MPDAAIWSTPEARVLELAKIGPALVELASVSAERRP
jgi:hypothetical protein